MPRRPIRDVQEPSARTMFRLKDYLLDIPLMLSPAGRDEVIGELDQDIGRNIRRYGDASSDTYSILRTCLDYPGGLHQLLETLRGFVGNSLALRRLEQEIAQMLGQ